jgi:20S proteasome subunit alpha 2
VSLLIAGTDSTGHSLYQVDPSGTYWAWKASAIGKNMVNAKTFLEKRYFDVNRYSPTMEIEDAVHNAILTLKEGMDGALSENLIEVGICEVVMTANRDGVKEPTDVFRSLSAAEIKDYLQNIV